MAKTSDPFYIIGRDFFDRNTGRYSTRMFWNKEDGWATFANATHYDEPVCLDEENSREFTLKVETREDGSQAFTEV